jgi:hypothetical protein
VVNQKSQKKLTEDLSYENNGHSDTRITALVDDDTIFYSLRGLYSAISVCTSSGGHKVLCQWRH